MKYYAQIDLDNIVVGVSQLSGEVNADNMIEITSEQYNSVLGFTYDLEAKKFEQAELPYLDENDKKMSGGGTAI